MVSDFNFNEVAAAYSILFDIEYSKRESGMMKLDSEAIKNAYRSKARQYHPDRAILNGYKIQDCELVFRKVTEAYKILCNFVNTKGFDNRKSILRLKKTTEHRRVTPNVVVPENNYFSKDFFYVGVMPEKKLRFGEFLFYSGRIDWHTMFDALIFQCTQRPMLGLICIELGYMDKEIVEHVMQKRELLNCEKFGEAAVRLGLVDRKQISNALMRQFEYRQPFGKYFLDKEIFTTRQLEKYLKEFHHYNLNVRLTRTVVRTQHKTSYSIYA